MAVYEIGADGVSGLRRTWLRTTCMMWMAVLGGILVLQPPAASADAPGDSAVERGRYLAAVGNCLSCHTRHGGAPFAGGVAFHTPFGTVYSTNITPEPETGIGRWSEEDFVRALREGVRPDGEHLYPVFPYTAFTKVTDEDAAALYAYLRTVEPVRSVARANELRFPFNRRWLLGLWKRLFFEPGQFVADASRSDEWNRGAYLVEGLGHCGACHTPRNFLGAEDREWALTGATYLHTHGDGRVRAWSSTNLTSAPSGLGSWSVEDIAEYLTTGVSARAGVFGPMNEVVLNSTRHLSAADARAVAVYLKSLPAKEADSGKPADEKLRQAGAIQYDIHCGTCHLPTGQGSSTTGPPLAGSSVVQAPDPATLINIVLHGPPLPESAPSEAWQARTWKKMEPFAGKLSDEDAAALLSYVRSSWGNRAGAVAPAQIAAQR